MSSILQIPCGLILTRRPCRKPFLPTIVVIADLEEFRRKYDTGFTEKNLVCRDCPGYFPTDFDDWGTLAADSNRNHSHATMHELLKMRGLETMTMEGLLTLFATFALTIPLENYLTFCPVDGNVVAYSVLISIMLGTTVFSKSYTIEDAVFPLAMSFYVGFGFNALLDARIAGLDKALLALLYRLGDRQWCLSCWDELW